MRATALLCTLSLFCVARCASTDTASSTPSNAGDAAYEEAIDGLETKSGLFELYLDEEHGRVLLALQDAGDGGALAECLYVEGLTTGLGSNPVGLDRGEVGSAVLIRFLRAADRIVIERPNLRFRARSEDADEVRALRESFATSVLWSGEVIARTADGRVLFDLTSFLVRDAHGTARDLSSFGGNWSLDRERSWLATQRLLAFPDNLEFEAHLTFAGSGSNGEVRSTAPDASSVTLVQHHSFVRLPDDGYRTRRFDPRAGGSPSSFADYAAGLDQPLRVRFAERHRLERSDPSLPSSPVVEPIVYYVDRGAPEPVRSALIEGASWWADAFTAAGFEDGFRVEVLPEGAHPLDVRYNVIQWVHRSTRGWSYGNSVSDPRTGEIIKGHVSLGSLRVRQDRLLFEGLAGTEATGTGAPDDPIELALARIRQLSAHEVGHTLGFAHNFTASTYADRASVMDYPAPLVRARSGSLDFGDVYGVGIGAWDRLAVRYLYSQFPDGADERAELDRILAGAEAGGLRFHSDGDARPPGAAQPYANLWDNFADPVEGLRNTLEVRRIAMARFGERNIAPGTPLEYAQEVFAPLYFHHRYQVDAAVKMLGGVDYDHRVRAARSQAAAPAIPAADQERALAALLEVLTPQVLDVPDGARAVLVPRAPGSPGSRELVRTQTAPTFDTLGAAATAASQVLAGLLQPERCARMVDQHRLDPAQPSLERVLAALDEHAFGGPLAENERHAEIQREIQSECVRAVMGLAADRGAPARVRGRAEWQLRQWRDQLRQDATGGAQQALAFAWTNEIDRFLSRPHPEDAAAAPAQAPPPGSPIGAGPSACSDPGY